MAIPQKTSKTISDIRSKLGKESRKSPPAPICTFDDLLENLDDEGKKLVTDANSIIQSYRDSNWIADKELIDIQTDIIRLESIKFQLTAIYGRLISWAESMPDELKITRSKIGHEAREIKRDFEAQGNTTRVTLDDIKELSYTETEETWKEKEPIRQLAYGLKQMYFAMRDMSEMLDKALHRLWSNEREINKIL